MIASHARIFQPLWSEHPGPPDPCGPVRRPRPGLSLHSGKQTENRSSLGRPQPAGGRRLPALGSCSRPGVSGLRGPGEGPICKGAPCMPSPQAVGDSVGHRLLLLPRALPPGPPRVPPTPPPPWQWSVTPSPASCGRRGATAVECEPLASPGPAGVSEWQNPVLCGKGGQLTAPSQKHKPVLGFGFTKPTLASQSCSQYFSIFCINTGLDFLESVISICLIRVANS